MSWRDTPEQWSTVSRAFHWVIALLILVMLVLGFVGDDMARSPAKVRVFMWHKSFGMLILTLAMLRLAWRAINERPAFPPAMPRWQVQAAKAGHLALYILILALPLSGWVMNSAADFPVHLFGWIHLPAIVAPDHDLKEIAEVVHKVLVWVLISLVTGHALLAIKHQWVDHDGVLRRMLGPSTK